MSNRNSNQNQHNQYGQNYGPQGQHQGQGSNQQNQARGGTSRGRFLGSQRGNRTEQAAQQGHVSNQREHQVQYNRQQASQDMQQDPPPPQQLQPAWTRAAQVQPPQQRNQPSQQPPNTTGNQRWAQRNNQGAGREQYRPQQQNQQNRNGKRSNTQGQQNESQGTTAKQPRAPLDKHVTNFMELTGHSIIYKIDHIHPTYMELLPASQLPMNIDEKFINININIQAENMEHTPISMWAIGDTLAVHEVCLSNNMANRLRIQTFATLNNAPTTQENFEANPKPIIWQVTKFTVDKLQDRETDIIAYIYSIFRQVDNISNTQNGLVTSALIRTPHTSRSTRIFRSAFKNILEADMIKHGDFIWCTLALQENQNKPWQQTSVEQQIDLSEDKDKTKKTNNTYYVCNARILSQDESAAVTQTGKCEKNSTLTSQQIAELNRKASAAVMQAAFATSQTDAQQQKVDVQLEYHKTTIPFTASFVYRTDPAELYESRPRWRQHSSILLHINPTNPRKPEDPISQIPASITDMEEQGHGETLITISFEVDASVQLLTIGKGLIKEATVILYSKDHAALKACDFYQNAEQFQRFYEPTPEKRFNEIAAQLVGNETVNKIPPTKEEKENFVWPTKNFKDEVIPDDGQAAVGHAALIRNDPVLAVASAAGTGKTTLITRTLLARINMSKEEHQNRKGAALAQTNRAADAIAEQMLQQNTNPNIIIARRYATQAESGCPESIKDIATHNQLLNIKQIRQLTVEDAKTIDEHNEITKQLKGIDAAKVDNKAWPSLQKYLTEQIEKIQQLKKAINEIYWRVIKPDIVVSTLQAFITGDFPLTYFSDLYIDESSMAPTHAILQCVAKLAPERAQQLLFVGDPEQLATNTDRIVGLAKQVAMVSIMESFTARENNPITFQLVHCYRSHSALVDMYTAMSYQKAGIQLIAATPDGQRESVLNTFPFPKMKIPICLVDIKGMDREQCGRSRVNDTETDAAVIIAKTLIKTSTPGNQIAIITPYDAQRRLIENQLMENKIEGVKVMTIDRSQGSEALTVILSLVRANRNHESNPGNLDWHGRQERDETEAKQQERKALGFLSDDKRGLVSLTRAKSGLIVLANLSTIRQGRYWQQFINYANNIQAIAPDNYMDILHRHLNQPNLPQYMWYDQQGYIKEPMQTMATFMPKQEEAGQQQMSMKPTNIETEPQPPGTEQVLQPPPVNQAVRPPMADPQRPSLAERLITFQLPPAINLATVATAVASAQQQQQQQQNHTPPGTPPTTPGYFTDPDDEGSHQSSTSTISGLSALTCAMTQVQMQTDRDQLKTPELMAMKTPEFLGPSDMQTNQEMENQEQPTSSLQEYQSDH